MMKFTEGTKLEKVVGPADSQGDAFYAVVSPRCAKSITVTMENSQGAGVPWALCEMHDGRQLMANLALMESVELLKGEKGDDNKTPDLPPDKHLAWEYDGVQYKVDLLRDGEWAVFLWRSDLKKFRLLHVYTPRELAAFMQDACRKWAKVIWDALGSLAAIVDDDHATAIALIEDWQSWSDANG
jgi:hypothetical protein